MSRLPPPEAPRHFPIALVLSGARAVVIGDTGREVEKRARALAAAGARVSVFTTEPWASSVPTGVHWYVRAFTPDDARGARVVVLCDRDAERGRALRRVARAAGALFVTVDVPAVSDFAHMAIAEAGPVTVAVGTSGAAPALARHLRDGLARGLDDEFGEFARSIAEVRSATPRSELANAMRDALHGFDVRVELVYPRRP